MLLFPTGIALIDTEYKCLLHVEADPEQWLRDTIIEMTRLRRDALIKEWQPRLFADPNLTELPADYDDLAQLILERPDYKSRTQKDMIKAELERTDLRERRASARETLSIEGLTDTEIVEAYRQFDEITEVRLGNITGVPSRRYIGIFEGTIGRSPRDPSTATITLFPDGVEIPDLGCNCILAYSQDLDNGIIGALLGHINRGKKKMIQQYHPIILADPSVTTMPGTEDGLINMIVARSDYQRLGG